MSLDRLIEKIKETENPSVIGLDPKLDYVPEFIKRRLLKRTAKHLKPHQRLSLHSTRELSTLYAMLFPL